jgi:hypothetical protein
MDFDMTAFLQNETCGLKKFEEVLSDDVYCTVPEALAQSYGVVCSPSVAMNEEGVPAVVPPVQVSDTVMFLTKVNKSRILEVYVYFITRFVRADRSCPMAEMLQGTDDGHLCSG